jgi:hypothetical protein
MDSAFETPPKKPRVGDSPLQETAAGDSGSSPLSLLEEEEDAEDAEEEVENAEDEGGGLTPLPRDSGKITCVPIQQHTNVMVVSGGMVAERKNRAESEWHVLKTLTIKENGGRVMWHIKCGGSEACRVLTGTPACYRPLAWKTNTFFKNFRDAVVAQETRRQRILSNPTLAESLLEKGSRHFATKKSWRVARRLVKITMGEHTMVVENTTKQCYIEATCANVDFVIKQLKSAE